MAKVKPPVPKQARGWLITLLNYMWRAADGGWGVTLRFCVVVIVVGLTLAAIALVWFLSRLT